MLDIKSKGPGFDPHPGHGDFLRVRDRCIWTLINHSQDLGMSRLRSIVHKTWAYQDSDQSFARFGHIRTYAHYELHMPVLPMIDLSLLND